MNNKQNKKLTLDELNQRYASERNGINGKNGIKLGCNAIFSLGCLILMLMCCLSIYLLITQPGVILSPITSFINSDFEYPENNSISEIEAQQQITEQLKAIGDNDVVITEEQLTAIVRPKFPDLRDLTFDIEDNKGMIYWKTGHSEYPFYMYAEVEIDNEGQLVIKKIGTPRVQLPDFVINNATTLVQSVLDTNSENNVLGSIINNNNIKINNIDLTKDNLHLNLNIKFDLFPQ